MGLEHQQHTFRLSNKQTIKLQQLIDLFYQRAARSPAVSQSMLLLLGGVRYAILEGEPLEQHQIDVVLWVMELYFNAMDEQDFDPLAERVFCKIAGWWYFDPPWFERISDYDLEGNLK
jgi:hypothetical protein